MRTDFPYIIIGQGGLGSGAAYWLARRAGTDVLALEQFEIGSPRSSSWDNSRIIRLSYHTTNYVNLAKEAYAAWATVERESGEKIVVRTGGLDIAPREGAKIPMTDYTQSMTEANVPFEQLDAAEIMRRWPQFQLTDDIHGVFQSESGIASPNKANPAHQRLAKVYGATIRDNAPVTSIKDLNGEIEVVAGGVTYRCKKLVLAVDAWSNPVLAHFGLQLPLTITQEQVTYFASPKPADFFPDRFPIWIWMDDPCFYGFPTYGEPGPKGAQDVGGDEVTADTRTFDPNPRAHRNLTDFLTQYIPGMPGPVLYTKTCLYTMPPDRDFVLDALPGHPDIFMGIGAAHAFKFASWFGRIFSELAIDGGTSSNIAPFKFDRPILKMANPPKNFMT
jgi:sarcosine oxidase